MKYCVYLFMVIATISCNNLPDEISNLTIFPKGNKFVLLESNTLLQIAEYNDAGKAIQSAVDLLDEGGTISLLNGEYVLNQTIYLAKEVSMKGSGRKTILKVIQTDSTGVGLMATGLKGITVSDMSIISAKSQDAVAGICFDHCGDSEIKDVYVEGFKKYGIWLRNNSFLCHINNCTATANMQANIYTDSLFWSRAGEYMPNLITNCITYGGYNGIETSKSIVLNIVGCIVHQPQNYGFYIHNVSNSVLISGSRTYQTGSHAVWVDKSHEINITGNIFCWSRGKGLVLSSVDWGTVSGNNIIDSGSERYGGFISTEDAVGLELQKSRCIQITGNSIFNWGGQSIMLYAIREDAASSNNSISSNNMNYYSEGSIKSYGNNTIVTDNIALKSPALNGNPDGPDPLFDPGKLVNFIRE
jgi:parallel beta-helix repeat protein